MSDIYCFFQFYTVRGDGQTHVVSRRSREVRTLFWVRRCKLYETATWRSLQSETCEGCYEDAEIYTIRNDHISWMLYVVQNISVSARACFSDPAWVPFIIQTSDDKVYLPNLFVKTRLVYLVKFRERFLGIQFWEQAVISLSRERKSLSERELKEIDRQDEERHLLKERRRRIQGEMGLFNYWFDKRRREYMESVYPKPKLYLSDNLEIVVEQVEEWHWNDAESTTGTNRYSFPIKLILVSHFSIDL